MRWKIGLLLISCLILSSWFFLYNDQDENTAINSEIALQEFAKLTAADPLFYSPFFDYDSFQAGIVALEQAETELKDSVIANLKTADANYSKTFIDLFQEHKLFPTDFLIELTLVSKATEAFLANTNHDQAKKLIAAYEAALTAYLDAAKSGVAVFEKINSYTNPNRPLLYFFVDSFTSVKLVAEDYRLIEKNALALQLEIERRKACLSGEGSCEVIRPTKAVNDFVAALSLEPNLDANTTEFIKNNLPGQNNPHTIRGPYPTQSSCWGKDNGSYWLYLIYSSRENYPDFAFPKLVDQNYYRIVSPQEQDTFSQAVRALGLNFYHQLETTTYECTDLTFYPQLLTYDFIKKEIEEGRLTNEELLASDKYRLLINNQFGLLGPAFSALALYTDILEASQNTESKLTVSPQFLYTTRSAYSLTFMPFASSVWRLDEYPRYLHPQHTRPQTDASKNFYTYTELTLQGYSDETISSAHISQIELIESLKQQQNEFPN